MLPKQAKASAVTDVVLDVFAANSNNVNGALCCAWINLIAISLV